MIIPVCQRNSVLVVSNSRYCTNKGVKYYQIAEIYELVPVLCCSVTLRIKREHPCFQTWVVHFLMIQKPVLLEPIRSIYPLSVRDAIILLIVGTDFPVAEASSSFVYL